MPTHCLREMHRPKVRSAITANSTTPPARTAWTSDSGATAIAATWKIQAAEAISIPIANSLEANSALAERSGWRMSTAGAAHAPRCLNRNPTFVVRAQASARRMPRAWVIR